MSKIKSRFNLIRPTVFIGIDPGTNKAGFAVIKDGALLQLDQASSKSEDLRSRIHSIATQVSKWVNKFTKEFGPHNVCVGIEEGVYRGKAANALLRLIGALEYKIPADIVITRINQSTVKKEMGSGKFDKIQVAHAVLKHFGDSVSNRVLTEAINLEEWDKTDAVAVALILSKMYEAKK